jgi:4-amino-4-deoxy-L-arabinose transferase-like glycosyltransferase
MPQFFKNRWPLFVVLLAFIIAKVPYLNVAYYWDESWPYATAVKQMYRNGIGLLPGALDVAFSRGHPLLFHSLAASWMHIFGTSHVAVHSFALTISVLFLIVIYETALSFFNLRTAILVLLSVLAQEMFFVQSSMLLPEVLVALLCFLSIVCYVRGKYVLTAICLSILFYTKESGLIAGFVLGADALVSLFNKNLPIRKRAKRILAITIPCVLICIHFAVQKHLRGWYLFPGHTDKIHLDWKTVWFDFRLNSVVSQFTDYSKYWYSLLLIALAAAAAIKQRRPRYMAILLPAICIWYFVDDMRAGRLLPSVPFFIIFLASVCYFLYEYTSLFAEKAQKKLITLFGLFILCYLIFSGMNFFTPRYMLASIMPMLFICAATLDAFLQQTWKWLIYPVTGCIIFIAVQAWATNERYGDCDLKGINALQVHQGVVDYFEKNVPYDANVSTGLCLESVHLQDPGTGFLRNDSTYKIVRYDIDGQSDYVIFDNIEGDSRYENFKKDSRFALAKRVEKGKIWGEIYKRK